MLEDKVSLVIKLIFKIGSEFSGKRSKLENMNTI